MICFMLYTYPDVIKAYIYTSEIWGESILDARCII
jgi:hypothetical protein